MLNHQPKLKYSNFNFQKTHKHKYVFNLVLIKFKFKAFKHILLIKKLKIKL